MTELILVPIAAVEIPKAKAINSLPSCLISYLFIFPEGSSDNSSNNANTKVVNDVTKYAVKLETFLVVTCAANTESTAAKATLDSPICEAKETTTPTTMLSTRP